MGLIPGAGTAQASTVVDEYSRGFWVGFAIALAGVAATLSMIREKDIPAERLEEARVPVNPEHEIEGASMERPWWWEGVAALAWS